MATERPARTLADQIRGWPDERVAALLRARPDLASPAPQDSSQLAARAATRSSILPALDRLDHATLHVLDALVITAPLPAERRPEPVALLHAEPDLVHTACRRLTDLALVWQSPEGLVPLTEVTALLAGSVSGLHPCSSGAPTPDEVAAALAALGDEARALLDHVASHGGVGTAPSARRHLRVEDAATPVEELLSRGLLVPHEERTVRVPGEVGLALRGGRTTTEPVDQPPEVALTQRDPVTVDQVAAGAAFETVRRVVALLEQWAATPPAVLRSGGLSVRDLRQTAEAWHVDEQEAAICLELAAAAGLLATGTTTHGESAWLPTPLFDTLVDQPPAEQWAALVEAWLATTRSPGMVGTRQSGGKVRNALGPDLEHPLAPTARQEVLTELAGLPEGACLARGTGVPALVARLQWRRPRRRAPYAELVEQATREAAVLGLTGRDGATSAARALVAGGEDGLVPAGGTDAARQRMAELLPAPVDHVLLQADLTAVAPGPLRRDLAEQLHQMADVESGGGASVHRFSQASLRRALEAGWSGKELHAFLDRISPAAVPQPLSYLVDDTVRTFARLRVGRAESFVRTDDEAALTALLHDSGAAGLELHRIAPTVVVSPLPADELVAGLRELGHSPVAEGVDGTVHVSRPRQQRAPRPRGGARPGAGEPEGASADQADAAVATLRAGDRAAGSRSTGAAATPGDALTALRNAIEAGAAVRLRYVDNNGIASERMVDPWRVRGGVMTGHDHRSQEPGQFAVHRITWVQPVEQTAAPPPGA